MKISKVTKNGLKKWKLDFYQGPARRRRFFDTKEEAETEATRMGREKVETGSVWSSMRADERAELVALYKAARGSGVNLAESLREMRDGPAPLQSVPLRQAVEETIRVKRESNRRERYVRGLHSYLDSFARGREEIPIAQISGEDLVDWFAECGGAASTRASNMGRLAALFTVAEKRGWIRANPMAALDRPVIEPRAPVVFTARQCTRALVWSKRRCPRLLPWLVLALLAGLRPEEAEKVTWGDVDFAERTIRVTAAAGKVRTRRNVHMTHQCWVWLMLARDLGGVMPLPHASRRRYLRACRDNLGLQSWPQDVLRKTFASNTLTLWQDAGRLANEMGTSVRMIFTNYRELVSRKEAARFEAIMPRLFCRLTVPDTGSRSQFQGGPLIGTHGSKTAIRVQNGAAKG